MRAGWLLALAALGIIALGGGVVTGVIMSRGVRNNNPGNIRASKDTKWQGQIGVDDKGFVIFARPVDGLRALAVTLRTYRNKHGLSSVEKIISRWAPPNENDTAAYIASVAQRLRISATATLPFTGDSYGRLVRAIVKHENGVDPYSDAQIAEAMTAAGFV